MSKLITFFVFVFLGCTMLSAIMEGGGGIVAVPLSSGIDNDDTTLSVTSTTDYLDTDYVVLDDEEILYSGKTSNTFTGCTRGYNDTTAASHASGTMIYTKSANLVNSALGFNVAATQDSMGWWAVITIPIKFMTKTLPNIIVMNYSFLTGSMAIVGWFFLAIGIGLIIVIALSLAGGRRV